MSFSRGSSLSFSIPHSSYSKMPCGFCEVLVQEWKMPPVFCVKEVYPSRMPCVFCVLFCRISSSVVSNLFSVTVLLPPKSSVQFPQKAASRACLMSGQTNRSSPSKTVFSPQKAYCAAALTSLPICSSSKLSNQWRFTFMYSVAIVDIPHILLDPLFGERSDADILVKGDAQCLG